MKRIIEVDVNLDKLVLIEKTKEYFTLQGFEITEERNNILIFKRGNIFLNMVTFDPLKWKSQIEVEFFNKKVKADFNIDSIFQVTTKEEENLWDQFILNFQNTLITGTSFINANDEELSSVKKSQWKYLLFSILGAIVFGIPFGIISYYIGNPKIGLYGVVGGSVLFLMWKVNTEKKKDS